MRRFEFVEGSSAKFWMAGTEGCNFIVVFGRLGTAGQRKEKTFPSEEAARKEYEKKLNEKLREGYQEVAADSATAAPAGAKGAAARSAKLDLPPRFTIKAATPAALAKATAALKTLDAQAGKRSWKHSRAAHEARSSLDAIAGIDPASNPALQAALDGAISRVVASKGKLSLQRAMELLYTLDIAAFSRALTQWTSAAKVPAGVSVIAKQLEALEDPELALRLGSLLVAKPGHGATDSAESWARRWRKLEPHLMSHAVQRGSTLKKYIASIDALGDASVTANVARLRGLLAVSRTTNDTRLVEHRTVLAMDWKQGPPC